MPGRRQRLLTEPGPGSVPRRFDPEAAALAPPKYAYLHDGIVPWDDARVHIGSVGFKFGTGVFEGIRGYWNARHEEMYLFRLDEHMRRFVYSQTFMRFDEIVDPAAIAEGIKELVRANGFRETVHIMATVFVDGPGAPGTCGPVSLAITAAPLRTSGRTEKGVTAQVSSWQRVADNAMPMRVKCNANYNNGRLATLQAVADGYDTAILLNGRGKVSEGPGMCLFIVRDGVPITPALSNDVLESITRATLLELLGEHFDVEPVERDLDRSELVAADEAFFCGTAWEVTPITSIDRLPVGGGGVGPMAVRLRELFTGIATGESPDHAEWRTPVYRT